MCLWPFIPKLLSTRWMSCRPGARNIKHSPPTYAMLSKFLSPVSKLLKFKLYSNDVCGLLNLPPKNWMGCLGLRTKTYHTQKGCALSGSWVYKYLSFFFPFSFLRHSPPTISVSKWQTHCSVFAVSWTSKSPTQELDVSFCPSPPKNGHWTWKCAFWKFTKSYYSTWHGGFRAGRKISTASIDVRRFAGPEFRNCAAWDCTSGRGINIRLICGSFPPHNLCLLQNYQKVYNEQWMFGAVRRVDIV